MNSSTECVSPRIGAYMYVSPFDMLELVFNWRSGSITKERGQKQKRDYVGKIPKGGGGV